MEIGYKRDLNHNYMVILGGEGIEDINYCIKMLSCQSVEGVLAIERRMVDNQTFYYYDITAKQSISNVFNKTVLSHSHVKQMLYSIIKTIEESYEYLLYEDDFILDPDLVYLDISNNKPYLCYYSGYNKNIKEQMSDLIEFLMNKVDYKDKEAVVLIYSMYSTSKQETFTFSHLKETLQNTKPNINEYNQTIEKPCKNKIKTTSTNIEKTIPVMLEKVVSEQERSCYSLLTYIYTGIVALVGLLIIVICIQTKLVYNSIGSRIDYTKLLSLLLFIVSVGGFVLNKIWNKKNQITKIVPKKEYIDPREDDVEENNIKLNNINEKDIEGKNVRGNDERYVNHDIDAEFNYLEEDYNPTCILNESSSSLCYILRSIDNTLYEDIRIKEFPFFIGKLKQNVDYCLNNEAVSRYHAKITKEEDMFYLFDLNSMNGTFINDERLTTYKRTALKLGDLVTFADVKYIFEMGAEL